MATNKLDLLDILADLSSENQHESIRSKRKRTRGLPEKDALLELARTYLKVQHRLWPALAKAGLLPKRTDANAARMADQFRESFEGGVWTEFRHGLGEPPWTELGAAYLRYSDLGSNPRSLDQQLLNVLEKARQYDVFVPWEFVFGDAAVTGTIAARRGYQIAKAIIQRGPSEVRCLFIDELGRASRDSVEALHLGRLIELSGKRMIGASDGFDSASPTAKMQLHIYAMIHELFVDQLREKVKRGMRDAFEEGKNLHPPAVGYKLAPVLDEDERPVLDDEGRPMTERVIDEVEAPRVLEAFELYADRSWSRDRIARKFNEQGVGGTQKWDSSRVKQLLSRSTYRGVEFYEMTYQVRDPSTGGVTVKRRPPSKWKRREVPHLRIIEDDLWDRTAARLAKSKEAYDANRKSERPSRTELHPKTLVRPVCGECGKPLWLGRSGKYASFCCLQGKDGKAGCTLTGYKSARIIEKAVIGRVRQEVLTEAFVAEVFEGANRFLSDQPDNDTAEDVGPLEALIRKKLRAINSITAQLGNADETTDLKPVFDRVAMLQREVAELKAKLLAMKGRGGPKPSCLTIEAVTSLVDDLRNLLQDDIGAAAPVLAALTGPVVVTQEVAEEGDEPVWVARFALNAVPVLLSLAAKRDCPTTGAWEFLNTRGWTMSQSVAVVLKGIPKYEAIAADAVKMADSGASTETIGRVLRTTWQTAKAAIDFAKSGGTVPILEFRQKEIAEATMDDATTAEVVRLREEEGWSFTRIAAHFGISHARTVRAYDRLRPEALRQAVAAGTRPKRGRYRYLDGKLIAEVEAMLRAGRPAEGIAKSVGCGVSTVYRERRRLGLADKT